MFDLDPEVANDPFAAIQSFPLAATSRAERDQAALLRAKGDLRRVKVMVGDVGGELSGGNFPARIDMDESGSMWHTMP